MNIGEPVRTLVVEPIVSPVPDGDLTGRTADLPTPTTEPTPRHSTKRATDRADA